MGYFLMYIYKNKFATKKTNSIYLHLLNAEVAQLVELQPSKLVVASSSLVFRSEKITSSFAGGFFMPNSYRPIRCRIPILRDLFLAQTSEQTNRLLT